jgi:hypothetical protein
LAPWQPRADATVQVTGMGLWRTRQKFENGPKKFEQ